MRIGVIALLQESNTFSPRRTCLDDFRRDTLLVGEAVRERFAGGNHEVSGFFAELDDARAEAAPIFAARAMPHAAISSEAWRALMDALSAAVEQVGRCDGYLVAAHGSTVSEPEPDADGAWLEHVRKLTTHETPIIGTLDAHANLSPRMVKATDALIAYRTNPHVDQLACGRRAASLLVRTVRKDVRPTQAAAYPPLAINIERQDTSESPCRSLIDHADEVLSRPGVLADSVFLGFPYADVPEMGASSLVVTDGNLALAQQYAIELAHRMWTIRDEFAPRLRTIDEALDEAAASDGRVCLLDMGDNVGGGAPGDSTWLVHALARRRLSPAVVCLNDPAAVERCSQAGVGQSLRLAVGGASGPAHGQPFEDEMAVVGLFDGLFKENQPRHGGFSTFDQGPSAVVRTASGMTLLVTSHRTAPFSLAQLTSCNIDPLQFRFLAAKGVVAPVAAYRPVCRHFIRVNTPGVTTADLSRLEYKRRRRPMHPFETDFSWQLPGGEP